MKAFKTVDDYIASAPVALQGKLEEIRSAIREIAPEAVESISYGMPYYSYKGKLAFFSYTKTHLGLYVPPPIIQDHAKELEEYETATATVRFPLDENLPIPLIKKLVKARKELNEAKKAQK